MTRFDGNKTPIHVAALKSLCVTIVVLAATIVGLLSLSVPASPASAHDVLTSTDPAADSTVDGAQEVITLTFTEPPLAGMDSAIQVQVSGPDGSIVSSGRVNVDGLVVSTGVDLTAPGTYELVWRSVSVDGHPISGGYSFTSIGVTAPPSTTPTESTTTPVPQTPQSQQSETPLPSATEADSDGGMGSLIWLFGGMTVLFIAAVVLLAVIVRRSRTATP